MMSGSMIARMPNGPGADCRWRADGKTMGNGAMSIFIMILTLLTAVATGAENRVGDERIVGSWTGHANTGIVIKYRFTDQNVFWDIDDAEFKKEFPSGIQAK